MKPPARPRPFKLLAARVERAGRLAEVLTRSLDLGPTVDGRYRHWHTLRHMEPPEGLSHDEWWLAIKMSRRSTAREIPLLDRAGRPFWFTLPDDVLRRVQHVNLSLGGRVGLPMEGATQRQRDRYLFSSLSEEAITSSQMEGAATTRAVAKEMLRSRRPPRTDGERMIASNFRLLRAVQELRGEPLTPDLVLRLHAIAVGDTMDAADVGLRTPGEDRHEVAVVDHRTGAVLHQPPPAHKLPARLDALCAFANQSDDDTPFVPPVVRAILLHFWLAYDHPFVDGNGRTARALFYWSMLHQGFWLAEFISISRILREGYARYARAFLYTETDGNDLTYFVLNQLDVVERAIDGLEAYLERKSREIRETRAFLAPDSGLNHRQVALLRHALRHPGQVYTIQSHRTSHGVSTLTARKDLLGLVEKALLSKRRLEKRGRPLAFTAPADLGARLRGDA